MPEIRFDRFYRYEDLTAILQGWASSRPELFRLESIGRSFEGRDIWLCTVDALRHRPRRGEARTVDRRHRSMPRN